MRGDETTDLNERVIELVTLAREELGQLSLRRQAEGFIQLRAQRTAHPRRVPLVITFAAALAVLMAAFAARHVLNLPRPNALSYVIDGREGSGVDPARAIEPGAGASTLRFSDGTEVTFSKEARGRVRSIDEHGARIAVTGKIRVAVVPWRGSHWLFDLGPFLITVKGTEFTAEWNESEQRLEVILETGTIAVSGPPGGEPITLRAGQRLAISMRPKEVVIRDTDAEREARKTPATLEPPSDAAVGSSLASREAPSHAKGASRTERSSAAPATVAPAKGPEPSTWSAALAAGHYAWVLQQAERRGLDATFAEASSEELAALADAARYSRREGVARAALSAQIRRFPEAMRASDAAFLLGRLEENAARLELALRWYERCLEASQGGTYTSDALGRKMTLAQRLYGAARARPIADEYLRRFATGTYASAARALTRAP
jgi:hypothetical protein